MNIELLNSIMPGLCVRFKSKQCLTRGQPLFMQLRQPFQPRQARHEEVFAAAEYVEGLDAADESSDRISRNGKGRPLWLQADDWVTFSAETHKIAVVDPLLLQEFDSGHRLGTDEQEVGAARHFVICFRERVRIVRRSIRGAAPYESM